MRYPQMEKYDMNLPIEKDKIYQVRWKCRNKLDKLDKGKMCEVIAGTWERYGGEVSLTDLRMGEGMGEGMEPEDKVENWDLDDIGFPYSCVELGTFEDFPEYFL